jgi:DNA-binding transcriptional LysR family regulator
MVALCPNGSREASQSGPLTVNDLKSELIGLAADDPLGNVVSSACEAQGVEVRTRITVQTYQLARSLVEAGVGLTVVDPFTAASSDQSKLRIRPLAPAHPVQLFLLTAANAPLAQSARRLVKYLGESAKQCLERIA